MKKKEQERHGKAKLEKGNLAKCHVKIYHVTITCITLSNEVILLSETVLDFLFYHRVKRLKLFILQSFRSFGYN